MPYPRVNLVLNSYEDLRERAQPVVEWFDFVRAEVTDPLAEVVARSRNDYEPRLIAQLRDSDRLTRSNYTDPNWRKITARMLAGELDRIWIEYLPATMWFEIQADFSRPGGSQYSVFVERNLLGVEFPDQAQDALVKSLREGARMLGAATGFLTIDVLPYPYEDVMGCEKANWRRYEDQTRGYYWGNILSKGHIARLGGVEAMRREAPCVVVEDITSGDAAMVYLQSTASIADWPDASVRSLRDYLLPLLPGGVPDLTEAALAMHVIEDGTVPEHPAPPGSRHWRWMEAQRAGRPVLGADPLLAMAEADALSPGPRRPIPQERTTELFLDSMEVTIFLDAMPAPDVQADLVHLVEVWASQGIAGDLGQGFVHSLDRPSFQVTDRGDPIFGFLTDLGSAGATALDVLLERLELFAGARNLSATKIVLGHGGLD